MVKNRPGCPERWHERDSNMKRVEPQGSALFLWLATTFMARNHATKGENRE